MREIRIENTWKTVLEQEFSKEYFQNLRTFVRKEYQTQIIYPEAKLLFHAFDCCPFPKTKVVILGQDPYHGKGQAHGLCFSVPDGTVHPPSLVNILKEIREDCQIQTKTSGDLSRWARQGVLLLNSCLTVRENSPASHQNQGWEKFTDAVLEILGRERESLVFLLWGAFAAKKSKLIPKEKHLVLQSPHPSPLSAHRGFFGNRHFSKANAYLIQKGESPIDWS